MCKRLFCVFFAFSMVFCFSAQAFAEASTGAVSIDGTQYTAAQVNFYYSSAYMDFYDEYSAYINYGMFFDPQKSLADQEYGDGMTWRDFFLKEALENMVSVQRFSAEAADKGFLMPESKQVAYEEELNRIRTVWSEMGFSDYQLFLTINYGEGVDDALMERELYRKYLAEAYEETIYNGFTYSVEDLDKYYSAHADEYDGIEFAYYLSADNSVDTHSMAASLNGSDENGFAAYLENNIGESAELTAQKLPGSSLSDSYSVWLLDDSRIPGDVTAIDSADGHYVIMFLGRDTNDYKMVSFRHILITAQDVDGDGFFSESEIEEARDEADSILNEWKSGGATQDAFSSMANDRSMDNGSNTTGGLYTNVYKGMMVKPIDDWLFDGNRWAGDTTVVSYDGQNVGGYTGAHVLFFVGNSLLTYAEYIADSDLRSADYDEWERRMLDSVQIDISSLDVCGMNH